MGSEGKKNLREILSYIILIIVAFAATEAIQIAARSILNVDTPFVVVASGSMKPTLNVGDLLIIGGINSSNLKVGDIIIFRPPNPYWNGVPWVHRIVIIQHKDGNVIIKTKGDANTYPDPFWLTGENVIGKVIGRIPYIGMLSLALKNWAIPTVIIIIILAIIIFMSMRE